MTSDDPSLLPTTALPTQDHSVSGNEWEGDDPLAEKPKEIKAADTPNDIEDLPV